MNTAQKFTDTDSEDEKSEHDASRAATPIPEVLEVAAVTEGALQALEQASEELSKDEVCLSLDALAIIKSPEAID